MENKNTKSPVFEMILESLDETPSVAGAKVSDRIVPEDWQEAHEEGQLSVDILETEENIIAVATMAGASAEKIEVYVHNDLLTIRGERLFPIDEQDIVEFYHGESYWGVFSRTIVLPVDVMGDLAKAEYRNGVLTVIVPKKKKGTSTVPIVVVEE